MRRLDAPHARLVRRMRFLEVVDVVVGSDVARVMHEFIGQAAQRLDLLGHQNIREHDEPVAPVGDEVGMREHGSSVGVQ